MAACESSRTTRTGVTISCSTSTSTGTTGPGSGRATRRVGRGSSPGACTCSRPAPPSSSSISAGPPGSPKWSRRGVARVEGRLPPASGDMLYQINTRVWLTKLSQALGRPATLDDVPEAELDRVAGMGFDWIWLLSVWRTGAAGQRVSRAHREWRREFEETLPDLREDDIAGS